MAHLLEHRTSAPSRVAQALEGGHGRPRDGKPRRHPWPRTQREHALRTLPAHRNPPGSGDPASACASPSQRRTRSPRGHGHRGRSPRLGGVRVGLRPGRARHAGPSPTSTPSRLRRYPSAGSAAASPWPEPCSRAGRSRFWDRRDHPWRGDRRRSGSCERSFRYPIIDAIKDDVSPSRQRSKMEVVPNWLRLAFDHGIGPGVWDISMPPPRPSTEELAELIAWLPCRSRDCGEPPLRTEDPRL